MPMSPILYSTVDISWHDCGWVQSFRRTPCTGVPGGGLMSCRDRCDFSRPSWRIRAMRDSFETSLERCTLWYSPSLSGPALEMLTEVRRLDLAFMYSGSDPYRYPDPPSLFPKARHVRLLGWAHYPFVTAILHGEKAQLTSLCLDNLQDEGRTEDGRPFNRLSSTETPLNTLHERWPEVGSRVVVLPGPMRRNTPTIRRSIFKFENA